MIVSGTVIFKRKESALNRLQSKNVKEFRRRLQPERAESIALPSKSKFFTLAKCEMCKRINMLPEIHVLNYTAGKFVLRILRRGARNLNNAVKPLKWHPFENKPIQH